MILLRRRLDCEAKQSNVRERRIPTNLNDEQRGLEEAKVLD
jgi:hypothetical protein